MLFIVFAPDCKALSQKTASVIISPDPTEPRPSGSGIPLANARGSDSSGETMIKAQKTYTLSQLGWDKSVTLNGYKPSYTFNFPIAKSIQVQNATLHLKMTYSSALSSNTIVYIKLNNDIIQGISRPAGQNNTATQDIVLPVDPLSHDWQALTFSAYLYSSDNLCSPTVWIYISPESTITLSYLELPFNGTLNQLPYPFVDPTALDATPSLLVLPASPSQQDMISLLKVSERLGEVSADHKVKISTEFINTLQLNQKNQNNLLFIGAANPSFKQAQTEYPWPYLEKDGLFVNATTLMPLKNNPGLIMLAQSPWNAKYAVMSITGMNNLSLEKAVNAFILSEFKSLASNQTAIIDNINVSNDRTQTIEWHHTTFKEMGYSDKGVSGLGTHTLSYDIALPNNLVPANMSIKTQLTHPEFHDSDFSQLTLLINGVKQSSTWLNNDKSTWDVEIQDNALKPGKNKLEYIIDLHLAAEQCSRQNHDQIWAAIHADSTLEASFWNDSPKATLSEFPVPFGSESTIVLPKALSKNEIKLLAKLLFKFGIMSQGSHYFDIQTSDQINKNFIKTHHVILIGTAKTNPWIALLMDFLPIQINEQTRLLNRPEKQMTLTDNHSVGLLEIIKSPWSAKKNILLITGNNEESLLWAVQTLTNDKRRSMLNGNIALIHSDHSISTLTINDNGYISYLRWITNKTIRFIEKTVYFIQDNPSIIIYILIFLISIAVYIQRRNRTSDKKT